MQTAHRTEWRGTGVALYEGMTMPEKSARCVSLLFRVLSAAHGERAILHAGEKPYLVGPQGRLALAHDDLTASAMRGLVRELLPEPSRDALARVGATRYELPLRPDLPGERFEVDAHLDQHGPVVEVRRLLVPEEDYVPQNLFLSTSSSLRPADGAPPCL
jgi:hypothetical protein